MLVIYDSKGRKYTEEVLAQLMAVIEGQADEPTYAHEFYTLRTDGNVQITHNPERDMPDWLRNSVMNPVHAGNRQTRTDRLEWLKTRHAALCAALRMFGIDAGWVEGGGLDEGYWDLKLVGVPVPAVPTLTLSTDGFGGGVNAYAGGAVDATVPWRELTQLERWLLAKLVDAMVPPSPAKVD